MNFCNIGRNKVNLQKSIVFLCRNKYVENEILKKTPPPKKGKETRKERAIYKASQIERNRKIHSTFIGKIIKLY